MDSGILDTLKGYFSLSKDVNKIKPGDKLENEGVSSDLRTDITLDISDEELIKQANAWEQGWRDYYSKSLKAKQDTNEKYWEGKINIANDTSEMINTLLTSNKPVEDNLIFEALETFLPIATKEKPEPVVTPGTGVSISKEEQKIADSVCKMLIYHSDILKIGIKMKQILRFWSLYYLGIIKIGWSTKRNDVIIKTIKTNEIILDPDAIIDEEGEYAGEFIGEVKEETAKVLIERFKSQKKFISEMVENKLNTKIKYTEWWTEDILFWKLKDTILDKRKNPHWNYDITEKETIVDDYGNETIKENVLKGKNHFAYRKMPYLFFSIFNLKKHPHDDTNLMEQNIANQEKINKLNRQINTNIENINGGWIVSKKKAGLNDAQAEQVVRVVRKGGAAVIPDGSASEAITKLNGLSLPVDVYNERQNARNELRGVFGITGLSPQGTMKETTVRGKIMIKGQDADRIGGGITEFLEQFYDNLFNWLVQMYYVYYDEPHISSVLGGKAGKEFAEISRNDLFKTKLFVSVREGSTIPKDTLTKRNEAIDLWQQGAIDPISLFERLEFSNPQEMAQKLFLWKTDPMAYLGIPAPMSPMQQMAPNNPQPSKAQVQPMQSLEVNNQGLPNLPNL